MMAPFILAHPDFFFFLWVVAKTPKRLRELPCGAVPLLLLLFPRCTVVSRTVCTGAFAGSPWYANVPKVLSAGGTNWSASFRAGTQESSSSNSYQRPEISLVRTWPEAKHSGRERPSSLSGFLFIFLFPFYTRDEHPHSCPGDCV